MKHTGASTSGSGPPWALPGISRLLQLNQTGEAEASQMGVVQPLSPSPSPYLQSLIARQTHGPQESRQVWAEPVAGDRTGVLGYQEPSP